MAAESEAWNCEHCGASNDVADLPCQSCGTPRTRGRFPTVGPSAQSHSRQAVFASAHGGSVPVDGRGAEGPEVTGSPVTGAIRENAAGRSGVSRQTMLLPAASVRAPAGESTIETGAAPIVNLRIAPPPPPASRRRASAMARALPLVGTVGLLVAGLVAAAVWLLAAPTPTSASQSQTNASASPTVDVESMTAIIGLSEDNKENVLTLCWRASTNPNEECRRAWLEQLGEFPHREVSTPPLSVDVHEVSNALYQECVLAGACPERDWEECRYYSIFRYEFGRDVPDDFRAPERPAVCITFEQANALCSWRDMRVPTADEWEALARAGDDRLWPWGRFWAPGILNWGEFDMMAYPIAGRLDGEQNSAPVDAYPDGANPRGLLNVLGNVAEWTRARDDDPQGHSGVRGGSYTDNAMDLRLSRHATIPSDQARSNVGIRCVADR